MQSQNKGAHDYERALHAILGEDDFTVALLGGWEASQAAAPSGALFFLMPSFVAMVGQEAGLSPNLVAAMSGAAARIAEDPLACALAWHIHYRLFHLPRFPREEVDRWLLPFDLLPQDAGLLFLLALCGGVPDALAFHRAHGVPSSVSRETLRDLERWANHYRRHHGEWGIEPSLLRWFRLHMRGELYDLGRLQFQPTRWTMAAWVFRHRVSGRVVALAEDGVRFGPDGLRIDPDEAPDSPGAWTARLALDADWAIGHPITPRGAAQQEVVRLPRAEWDEALVPGDLVLDLHIPRGAPLDLEACRRSLEEAPRFFAAHFPERPFVAFACHSWLLDPQLADLLPPSTNLVRFQRQMYLIPTVGDQEDTLYRIFDGVPADLKTAPRDTSLRRAVLDHLGPGGTLGGGGCFLFPEDLPAWGTDIYNRFSPAPSMLDD